MEKIYNTALQDRVRAYIESGVSQAELARRLGMNNSSTISRWLKSSYSGDVEKVEKALEEFFRVQEAAEEAARRPPPTARPGIMYRHPSAKTCTRASATASCTAA